MGTLRSVAYFEVRSVFWGVWRILGCVAYFEVSGVFRGPWRNLGSVAYFGVCGSQSAHGLSQAGQSH
jgi:hypothetical protein